MKRVIRLVTNTLFIFRDNFQPSQLNGRRIIDVNYFLQKNFNFQHHGLFDCKPQHLYVKKEIRNGMISKFLLSCTVCKMEQLVETEDPNKKTFNINGAVVNASISIGIGYSQMSEFTSLLEIPPLSKKKWVSA